MILNSLFQNGAVLQRNMEIPVWGQSASNSRIRAELAGNRAFTKTSSAGDFLLRLPALEAGGPYELTVSDLDTGESVVVKDVLVGEVWLASGQSNMEYTIGTNWSVSTASGLNSLQEAEFCNSVSAPEKFRFFKVEKNASGTIEKSCAGSWKQMDARNALDASAVAAWFGRALREKLDVPVGLIVSAWGGTIAEAWTSRSGLLTNPDTASMVRKVDAALREESAWDSKNTASGGMDFSKLTRKVPGNKGVDDGWARPLFNDSAWKDMTIPGNWIEQEIAGNGAVWFRKKIMLPPEWVGRQLILETGGIDKHDITYFNGVEIGRTGADFETEYWNTRRKYPVPAGLAVSGENTIAIRAYSFLFAGAFWGSAGCYRLYCPDTDESIPIAGTWKAFPEFDMGVLPVPVTVSPPGPGNANTPGILFDSMIRPLIPYAIRGVIWYQGESNAHSLPESSTYLRKLETMIRDWRYRWGQGDFPFLQVQLANYRKKSAFDPDSAWAVLRENQRLACEEMPEVYMASAIDVGDALDIHPQDKHSVGNRLAANALRNVYHRMDAVPSGPLLRSCTAEYGRIRMTFAHADGLTLKADAAMSFYIAGKDGEFHPAAHVVIEGDSVLVDSPDVPIPCKVCYAWSDNPVSSLYNAAGLPASSFRADAACAGGCTVR